MENRHWEVRILTEADHVHDGEIFRKRAFRSTPIERNFRECMSVGRVIGALPVVARISSSSS